MSFSTSSSSPTPFLSSAVQRCESPPTSPEISKSVRCQVKGNPASGREISSQAVTEPQATIYGLNGGKETSGSDEGREKENGAERARTSKEDVPSLDARFLDLRPCTALDDQVLLKPKTGSPAADWKRPAPDDKTTSFKDEVEFRTNTIKSYGDGHVSGSYDEEEHEEKKEDVSDNAIEDDDSDDNWEDSATDTSESSFSNNRPNLVSRRSNLSILFNRSLGEKKSPEQAAQLQPVLQQSSISSVGRPLKDKSTLDKNGRKLPRSKPIIMTSSNTHQRVLSPRTTRRNMLARELSMSLKQGLLWEHVQNSKTANAVFNRLALDGTDNTSKNDLLSDCFDHTHGYHSKGW